MREYLLDIRSGAPDAQTKYQTFLKTTGAAVQEHMEVFTLFLVEISPFIPFLCFKQAQRCELWAAGIYADCEATFFASVFDFCEKLEFIFALLSPIHADLL
jgi:hypothetical protein